MEADPSAGTLAACQNLIDDEPNAVATHALRVVFYLDGNGDECYSFAHEGNATLSAWLGCMELLREDIIAEFRPRGPG